MPKFLIEASYTLDGVKGVQSAGGSSRRDAVAKVAESVGGTLEAFYFAFGDSDAVVIVDLPDNESATAVALTVNASGGASVKTVVLLMPKFLFEASYTLDGVKGVQSAGGTSRRDAVAQVAESVGGRLESFYFAFGNRDAYVVVDLPDNESATAVALTVNAAGGATVRTVVLLTPDEVDAAAKRSVDYRPPGT